MKFKAITQNRWVALISQTVTEWMEDGALKLSAALAYYSVFSIAPLLIICISIAGLVFGAEAVRGQLDEQLSGYIGKQAALGVQSLVKGASKPAQGWIGTVVGFAVLLLGASGVFGQLKSALNTIWDVKVTKTRGVMGYLREYLLSFGMVLVLGFLLLVSLLLSTAIAALNKYLNSYLGLPAEVWTVLAMVVSILLLAVLFATLFKVLPDIQVQWRDVWVGALATAVLFEAGKFGLGFYLGRESTASTYGAAASVVLLLLWVYYASCILLFGSEFTQVYARASGRDIKPAHNAELISEASSGKRPMTVDGSPAVPRHHQSETAAFPLAAAVASGTVPTPSHEKIGVAGAFLGTLAVSYVIGLALRRALVQR
jgi:membrane protein